MAKRKLIGDPRVVEISKLDVAAEFIKTAVHLFFDDAHPAPIYLLAASAREITTVLGDKLKVQTVLTDVAKRRGEPRTELIKHFHRHAGFMKHADRQPAAKIELPYNDVEMVLQVACHDFGRVSGGMPVEAQIFEIWIYTIAFHKISDAPLRRQDLLRRAVREYFPGIRTAAPSERRQIGKRTLEKALKDPSLEMKFRREITAADLV